MAIPWFLKVAVLCLLTLFIGGARGHAEALRTVSNTHFDIVSFDSRSLNYVNELSQYITQVAERYIPSSQLDFPVPVLVNLRPAKYAEFEGDYRIEIEERGGVRLDLKWASGLSLQTTCFALSEALITQYKLYDPKISRNQNKRIWPVSLLATEAYLSLRPAQLINFQSKMLDQPPLIGDVLAADSLMAPDDHFAYWLVQALTSSGFEREAIAALYQQAVAGLDVSNSLDAVIQSQEPTAQLSTSEQWWQLAWQEMSGRNLDIYESMQTSREWLEAISKLDALIELEGKKLELDLRNIWNHRNESAVRELIQARVEILRFRLNTVNPAYYNAAQSLGALYETLLSDLPVFDYVRALTAYLADWEDTKQLHLKVEEELKDM